MLNNIYKKIAFSFLSTTLILSPYLISVSCSSPFKDKNRSDLEFYNYVDYMSTSNKDVIKKEFKYFEFGDLLKLEQGINDQRISAGIGSDYFNASLAGKGKIAKINFSKIFGITQDKSKWKEELKKIYSKETFKLLDSFPLYKLDSDGNKILDSSNQPIKDLDNDGKEDKLWEYTIPYFIQNKVIAFNPFKVIAKKGKEKELQILKDNNQQKISYLFHDKTYKGIFDKLNSIGFNKLIINDFMRDNLMIGSESLDGNEFSGEVTSKDMGKKQLKGFKNKISSFGSPKNIPWIASGVDSLNSLLLNWKDNDKSRNADVALIYNGDALAAYRESKKENNSKIRIITPKNPTFLLDGIIIPKYITENNKYSKRIYGVISKLFDKVKLSNNSPNYTDKTNLLYNNFNNVNYTPAYKELLEYAEKKYFKKYGVVDEMAKNILLSPLKYNDKIDVHHITQSVNDNLEINLEILYEKLKNGYL